MQLLSFAPQGIRARRLAAPGAAKERPREMRFSPDGRVVAWYQCALHCTLYWYRIDEARYEQAGTPCPYSTYLDIGWQGDTPHAQFYWGATERDMCYDAEGKPALPKDRPPSAATRAPSSSHERSGGERPFAAK